MIQAKLDAFGFLRRTTFDDLPSELKATIMLLRAEYQAWEFIVKVWDVFLKGGRQYERITKQVLAMV